MRPECLYSPIKTIIFAADYFRVLYSYENTQKLTILIINKLSIQTL